MFRFLASCLNPPGRDYPHGDKSGEYLLFSRSGSVLGATVNHRVEHYNHSADLARVYYRFVRELPGHIKEVLIRNGVGTDYQDGARMVLYTGHQQWLLNNDGEHIQVTDSSGRVVLDQRIAANVCDMLPPAPKVPVIVGVPAVAAPAFGRVK